jgi:hypothetical protein
VSAANIFRDEQGKFSMSRTLLVSNTLFIFILGSVHVFKHMAVDGALWSLLGGMELAFVGWAGGRAMMQYLGPQIGAFASGISSAVKRVGGARAAFFEEDGDAE